MKKILYSIITLSLLVVSSCQKDQIDPGGTAVEKLSGEWWVQIDDGSGFSTDYYSLSTYNTADNSTTAMWMDDGQSYYGLKAKVNVNPGDQTFSVTSADELYFGVKVTIANGKVISGAATAPGSKVKTDSIYFEAEYSDSPGTTFKYSGYHRTKFAEDDH